MPYGQWALIFRSFQFLVRVSQKPCRHNRCLPFTSKWLFLSPHSLHYPESGANCHRESCSSVPISAQRSLEGSQRKLGWQYIWFPVFYWTHTLLKWESVFYWSLKENVVQIRSLRKSMEIRVATVANSGLVIGYVFIWLLFFIAQKQGGLMLKRKLRQLFTCMRIIPIDLKV